MLKVEKVRGKSWISRVNSQRLNFLFTCSEVTEL